MSLVSFVVEILTTKNTKDTKTGGFHGGAGAVQLRLGADEDADFFRPKPFAEPLRDPRSDRLRLRLGALEQPDLRRRPVEDRDGPFPAFFVAVDVGKRAWQQPIGLGTRSDQSSSSLPRQTSCGSRSRLRRS